MDALIKNLHIWVGRFRDSFTACILMMTQGDVGAIELGHVLKATETGFLTAVAAVSLVWLKPQYASNRYVLAGLTGFLTAIADFATHKSDWGGVYDEALLTGIAAGLMTVAFATIQNKKPSD